MALHCVCIQRHVVGWGGRLISLRLLVKHPTHFLSTHESPKVNLSLSLAAITTTAAACDAVRFSHFLHGGVAIRACNTLCDLRVHS